DYSEFVDGLSVFMKGTPDEKMTLSFKLYDVNRDGYLSKQELAKVMLQLSHAFSEQDQSTEIKQLIERLFQDLDVDGDGKLSFEEYKLSALKEPLMADFLEHFLDQHHISNQPRPPSIYSLRSYRSNVSMSRLHTSSQRLSQADLVD
ncbi:hypothetical protein BDF14DRAFT_1697166, partial [Spinellus fusiger]